MTARLRCRWLGAAALLLGSAAPVVAQTGHGAHPHPADSHPQVAEFLAGAREGTARYQDRNVAIAEGYRLLGPDFPGMGEHWIHPGLLIRAQLEASQPQVLTYARIGGKPALLGVAYALPLAEAESPPPFPPGVHWHDHTGTIDEESVLLNHTLSGQSGRSGSRVAMLHAWVWLENPAGVFADNNWSLPFLRLGLGAPADAPVEAAKALSLVSGGDAYYLALVRAIGQPEPREDAAAGALLERYRERLTQWVGQRDPELRELSAEELRYLTEVWRSLWEELDSAVGAATAGRLRPLWHS